MNKKYLLEIVFVNKVSFKQINFDRVFTDCIEAEKLRSKIQDNLSDNYYLSYNKIHNVIQCSCGQEVACERFTNTCDNCESDYNFSGDLLADRSQWGCETGETWLECY
jgi:hypothetical protein